MKPGDIVTYKGIQYRAERERSEFSCTGCALSIPCKKGMVGCDAPSHATMFNTCKHDRIIFVKVKPQTIQL